MQQSHHRIKPSHQRRAIRVLHLLHESRHLKQRRHRRIALIWVVVIGILCVALGVAATMVYVTYSGGVSGF